MRILLVDLDESEADEVAVKRVASAQAARRALANGDPDIVLVNARDDVAGLQALLDEARRREGVGVAVIERDPTPERLFRAWLHDLRGQLDIVSTGTELLVTGPSPEARERSGEHVRAAITRIDGLSSHIRDVILLRDGALPLERSPCLPESLLVAACASAKTRAEQKGVVLSVTRRGPLPRFVLDAERVERALSCLVERAIDVTQPGGEVEACVEREGDRLSFAIRDGGPAIDPGVLPSAFDPPAPGERRASRAWLGLLFSRLLARAHGGDVLLGSTGVVMTLPEPPSAGHVS